MRKIVAVLIIVLSIFAFKSRRDITHASSLQDNLTIVEMEIDGDIYSFLYDTSAQQPMLDSTSFVEKKLNCHSEGIEEYTMLMDKQFVVKDLDKTVNNVEYHTGQKVDGIINSEIIQEKN